VRRIAAKDTAWQAATVAHAEESQAELTRPADLIATQNDLGHQRQMS